MPKNLALKDLTRAAIRKLPIGTPIFDGNMDIYVKLEETLWESEKGKHITTEVLLRPPHTPLRPYIPTRSGREM